jgi:hypothetical protein
MLLLRHVHCGTSLNASSFLCFSEEPHVRERAAKRHKRDSFGDDGTAIDDMDIDSDDDKDDESPDIPDPKPSSPDIPDPKPSSTGPTTRASSKSASSSQASGAPATVNKNVLQTSTVPAATPKSASIATPISTNERPPESSTALISSPSSNSTLSAKGILSNSDGDCAAHILYQLRCVLILIQVLPLLISAKTVLERRERLRRISSADQLKALASEFTDYNVVKIPDSSDNLEKALVHAVRQLPNFKGFDVGRFRKAIEEEIVKNKTLYLSVYNAFSHEPIAENVFLMRIGHIVKCMRDGLEWRSFDLPGYDEVIIHAFAKSQGIGIMSVSAIMKRFLNTVDTELYVALISIHETSRTVYHAMIPSECTLHQLDLVL